VTEAARSGLGFARYAKLCSRKGSFKLLERNMPNAVEIGMSRKAFRRCIVDDFVRKLQRDVIGEQSDQARGGSNRREPYDPTARVEIRPVSEWVHNQVDGYVHQDILLVF